MSNPIEFPLTRQLNTHHCSPVHPEHAIIPRYPAVSATVTHYPRSCSPKTRVPSRSSLSSSTINYHPLNNFSFRSWRHWSINSQAQRDKSEDLHIIRPSGSVDMSVNKATGTEQWFATRAGCKPRLPAHISRPAGRFIPEPFPARLSHFTRLFLPMYAHTPVPGQRGGWTILQQG